MNIIDTNYCTSNRPKKKIIALFSVNGILSKRKISFEC